MKGSSTVLVWKQNTSVKILYKLTSDFVFSVRTAVLVASCHDTKHLCFVVIRNWEFTIKCMQFSFKYTNKHKKAIDGTTTWSHLKIGCGPIQRF